MLKASEALGRPSRLTAGEGRDSGVRRRRQPPQSGWRRHTDPLPVRGPSQWAIERRANAGVATGVARIPESALGVIAHVGSAR